MLVSHRHRFIYTKTAKTGGTSVESFFERFCMPDGAWTQLHGRDEYVSEHGIIGYRGSEPPYGTTWWNHMPASRIKAEVGAAVWDSYFKFCVVRNPFEKCISAFCFQGGDYQPPARMIEELRHENLNAEQLRFIGFLQNHAPVDRDKYMIRRKFCLDAVIRYEALEEDIQKICDRIGVPYDRQYLPEFKRGIRPPDATVGSLYTKRSRRIVEKVFAFELRFFGYGFPGES
ncbi:MAG: sulfotransferase family protein [Mycobacterium sp.]|nr:sulfotransferase family protein [Mycobacterium sp.]